MRQDPAIYRKGEVAPANLSSKPTTQQTRVELARVWADHFGYVVLYGSNWIYSPINGLGYRDAIACGWEELAAALERSDWIKEGVGVNWRLCGSVPSVFRMHGAIFCRKGGQ